MGGFGSRVWTCRRSWAPPGHHRWVSEGDPSSGHSSEHPCAASPPGRAARSMAPSPSLTRGSSVPVSLISFSRILGSSWAAWGCCSPESRSRQEGQWVSSGTLERSVDSCSFLSGMTPCRSLTAGTYPWRSPVEFCCCCLTLSGVICSPCTHLPAHPGAVLGLVLGSAQARSPRCTLCL